jgi:hypothetical protein
MFRFHILNVHICSHVDCVCAACRYAPTSMSGIACSHCAMFQLLCMLQSPCQLVWQCVDTLRHSAEYNSRFMDCFVVQALQTGKGSGQNWPGARRRPLERERLQLRHQVLRCHHRQLSASLFTLLRFRAIDVSRPLLSFPYQAMWQCELTHVGVVFCPCCQNHAPSHHVQNSRCNF